ncbi:MAG: hpdC [Anaerosporomusa subterranea]|jgi:4-hydroxyphenylacetate decarboxylase small subunit|nr:hpdC [Anaerosporomusa subterranea]
MKKADLCHMDCLNYIAIDVAKGMCHANDDKIILADGPLCPKFAELPKCKFCNHFTNVDEKGIGCCEGFKVKDWTFADLKAVTCENFAK